MIGPLRLTRENIAYHVTRTSAGNYLLLNQRGNIRYVGRSDTNVRDRLLQHVGEGYAEFKFSYATSAKDAFETECRNYHDYGEDNLDNGIHPDRPDNSPNWKCPRCKKFG